MKGLLPTIDGAKLGTHLRQLKQIHTMDTHLSSLDFKTRQGKRNATIDGKSEVNNPLSIKKTHDTADKNKNNSNDNTDEEEVEVEVEVEEGAEGKKNRPYDDGLIYNTVSLPVYDRNLQIGRAHV